MKYSCGGKIGGERGAGRRGIGFWDEQTHVTPITRPPQKGEHFESGILPIPASVGRPPSPGHGVRLSGSCVRFLVKLISFQHMYVLLLSP